MPPLAPFRPLISSSTCTRSTSTRLSRRQISSTAPLRTIGPESPRFIQIPQPPQLPEKPLPPVKGTLPIPRDIFPPSSADKGSEEYFAALTKEPKEKSKPHGPGAPRVRYKAAMAEMRRRNLRAGLTELKDRRVQTTAEEVTRAKAELFRRRAQLNAPEREDERLTNPTVPQEVLDLLKKQRTPPKEITFANVKNTRTHFKQLRQRREEAIHILYTHARNFIVTEQQLDASIENTFGTDEDPILWGSKSSGWSVWDLGLPEPAGRFGNGDISLTQRETEKQRRLRKIAEAFTGGKI